ncbi:MAG: class I SAM-dependent methyltransferase [Pseudomonadota bacterium]
MSGEKHICPVNAVRSFDNFLRPLVHSPRKLFGPHVTPGMTAMDIGCGGGWASLAMARLVGESGLVIAADLQPEMLELVRKRAQKAGLIDRLKFHRCLDDRIGLDRELDFSVAFYMVHETPDARALVAEVFSLLKPGGRFFVAEPKFHVSQPQFESVVREAQEDGFSVLSKPRVLLSRAVVLEKPAKV